MAALAGPEGGVLLSLAKEGAGHLAAQRLRKDGRSSQESSEHAQDWGERVKREMLGVLAASEKARRLKTTEASEARRLLKEARAARALPQRAEASSQTEEIPVLLERAEQAAQTEPEEPAGSLAQSRKLRQDSPFTTPLSSRLEREDERLQKVLFGGGATEDEQEVPDEWEAGHQPPAPLARSVRSVSISAQKSSRESRVLAEV